MSKELRKRIETLLFEVYDKGALNEDCNLTEYAEQILESQLKAVEECKHNSVGDDGICYGCGNVINELKKNH